MDICQLEYTDFKLVRATHDDIPALLQVHSEGFAHDRFSQFMLQGRPSGTHEARMRKAIESWFDNVDAKLFKAAGEDGQILGWICYIVKTQPSSPDAVADGTYSQAASTGVQQSGHNGNGEGETPFVSRSAQAEVGAAMREDLRRAESKYMTESRFVVLQALATRPEYQRQGIASALVRCVVEEADARRLACWAHASPAASGLYDKLGFVSIGSGEYVLGRMGTDEEVYKFDFMKRAVQDVFAAS
ncbi:acyl-CoA N-acyltransferase [Teratosphaeria nubilosa]|uniref:Acyl-CoA N-acyltransferase n=1 Tax=Teratosphaeria nubilosa TaxID=161662 RepID=A0A6G1L1T5_9PEZI|nr:acyl-CoA N-acyltransferase [Teratosphaeria nubilosa]